MHRNLALAAGLGVVLLWASAFPAIRVAAPELGPAGLSLVRLAVATTALIVAAAVTRVRLPRWRDLGWIAGCGFFGMTAYQLLLNWGEVSVPAGTASIIVAAAPLVSVAVARLLFQEQVTRVTVAGSAVALAGVAFVSLARAGLSLSGAVWLVIGAMAVQGIYHPLQKPLLNRYTSLEVATYCMTAGTIMTLPFAPFDLGPLLHADAGAWAAAVYLGLLPSAAGFVLWAYAVSRMPVAAATSLLYLVPPVAVLIAWVWLGEVPVAQELIGGLIVIAGVAVVAQGNRLRARPGRSPGSGTLDVLADQDRLDAGHPGGAEIGRDELVEMVEVPQPDRRHQVDRPGGGEDAVRGGVAG